MKRGCIYIRGGEGNKLTNNIEDKKWKETWEENIWWGRWEVFR